jgi:thiol-disulfide isomerase/thioredoxin
MSRNKPTSMQLAARRAKQGTTPGRRTPAAAKPAHRAGRTRSRWIGRGLIVAATVAVVAVVVALTAATSPKPAAVTGRSAPNASFTTLSGATEPVSALRGQPTLLWLVTTWCSSCQAGTAAMAQQIPRFASLHVRVVELEMAGDLGQPGPPITEFAQQLGGRAYHNPDWTFGTASPSLTQEYNPNGYLDIYYLFSSAGRVVYTNGSPSATMTQLLAQAAKVGSRP